MLSSGLTLPPLNLVHHLTLCSIHSCILPTSHMTRRLVSASLTNNAASLAFAVCGTCLLHRQLLKQMQVVLAVATFATNIVTLTVLT